MIHVLRVWPNAGVNVWYTCDEPLLAVHTHLAQVIAQWDGAAHWQQVSDHTWKNAATGERIELLVL